MLIVTRHPNAIRNAMVESDGTRRHARSSQLASPTGRSTSQVSAVAVCIREVQVDAEVGCDIDGERQAGGGCVVAPELVGQPHDDLLVEQGRQTGMIGPI